MENENFNIFNGDLAENLFVLLNHGPVVFFKAVIIDDKLIVKFVGNNIENLIGYKSEEFINSSLDYLTIIKSEDKQKIVDDVRFAINNREKSIKHTPYAIKCKDNTIAYLLQYTHLIFNEDRTLKYVLGYLYDITKEKSYEELLKNLNNDLQEKILIEIREKEKLQLERVNQERIMFQQSKMAAMGEMIGAIARQWKQPLNTIGLIAQSLSDMYEFNELNMESIKDVENLIMRQIDFMADTINDFRNFFKPNKEQSDFNSEEAIEEIIKLLLPIFQKSNINIIFQKSEIALCKGLKNEFKQAILNILNNAKDAIIEKGVKSGIINIKIEINSHLNIYIRDNGGGIPTHLLPNKIFDSYTSTKGDKGTGVGLNISKTIIEGNMSGKIYAKNMEDGAEFLITLPISKRL